jgi:hypothetical protein
MCIRDSIYIYIYIYIKVLHFRPFGGAWLA